MREGIFFSSRVCDRMALCGETTRERSCVMAMALISEMLCAMVMALISEMLRAMVMAAFVWSGVQRKKRLGCFNKLPSVLVSLVI